MTDIVIPLGKGSRWDDNELRYALRGLEKHLSGYRDIYIIGEKPTWLTGVIHIPATDNPSARFRERNIYEKLMLACRDERVSESFLYMNDDHYLLTGYVAGSFPYYYDGQLPLTWHNMYRYTLINTKMEVRPDLPYFDVHAPMPLNKDAFLNMSELLGLDWRRSFGYCIKTAYCHSCLIQGEQMMDCKVRQPLPLNEIKEVIAGRSWFSIDNKAINADMKLLLQELYPIKSKYEI